ncbi:hypothetical protein JRO89_XS14G0141700 [Xanthoceras sorbifolium]|uniref:Uncharacterized protein n=1 Tax=Xanthoceras sorbifolium TaxID=99658 RepID=A0ABQ8H5E9_9ROSI|nr:hypothetical protein JRO89_XS14G0141700 [Xanthoceras sorbifolium]
MPSRSSKVPRHGDWRSVRGLERHVTARRLERKDPAAKWLSYTLTIRYGCKDKIEEPNEFERQLTKNLIEFTRQENYMYRGGNSS